MSEALLPSFLPAPGHQINRLSFLVALIFRQTTSVAADRQEIVFSLSLSLSLFAVAANIVSANKTNRAHAFLALGRFPDIVKMILDIGENLILTE